MKPKTRPVIKGQQELELAKKAEVLAAKGIAAFGDPNQKFDISTEMNVMTNILPKEDNKEISSVKEEMPEESQEEPVLSLSEDPVERTKQISEIIRKKHPTFLSGEQLLRLKSIYGDVYISDFIDRIFVYRYLKRQEWIQLNSNESYNSMREDQKESVIYDKCVLWPNLQPEEVAALPAGYIPTIVAQIERQSMFFDPREVAAVTIKI